MKKYVIALTVLVFLAVICGLSFFYFFHRSVRFDSDYDIDSVTITEETSGKIISKHADVFSHKAGYGKYRYEFVANNQKFMIDIFKKNNFEHDTVDIAIKSIDLGINTYVFIYCLDVIVSIVGYVIAKNNKIRFMNNR